MLRLHHQAELERRQAETICRLRFEYNGRVATLDTPSDIAAWIEERKKRFPTQQRIKERQDEETRRKAEETQRREAALARNRQEGQPSRQNQKRVAPEEKVDADDEKAAKAKRKREKIMKKLKQQEQKLAKLDAQMAASGKALAPEASQDDLKRKRSDDGDDFSRNADKTNPMLHAEDVHMNTDALNSGVIVKTEGDEAEGDSVMPAPPPVGSGTNHPSIKREESQEHNHEDGSPNSSRKYRAAEGDHEIKKHCHEVSAKTIADGVLSAAVFDRPASPAPDASTSSILASESSSSASSSTSSSSGSDDEGPTEISSRPAAPVQRTSPTKEKPSAEPSTGLCRQFLRRGYCPRQKHPKGCRYRHELTESEAATSSLGSATATGTGDGKKGAGGKVPAKEKPAKGNMKNKRDWETQSRRKGLYQRVSSLLCFAASFFAMLIFSRSSSGYSSF